MCKSSTNLDRKPTDYAFSQNNSIDSCKCHSTKATRIGETGSVFISTSFGSTLNYNQHYELFLQVHPHNLSQTQNNEYILPQLFVPSKKISIQLLKQSK